MIPGVHPNPFASSNRRPLGMAPHSVTLHAEQSLLKQHHTRQQSTPDDPRTARGRGDSSCPLRRYALFFAGLLALTLATSPGIAYAGWVVEGEPTVLTGFGEQYASELGTQVTHHGVDCLASSGAQCLFPTGGTVSFVGSVPAGDLPGCGTTMAVSLRIEDGRTVTLMPFDDVAVSVGQHVAGGQVAGTVASSGDGSATLPHVHVGLKRGRTYYDPSELLGIAVPAPAEAGGGRMEPAPVATGAGNEVPPALEPAASPARSGSVAGEQLQAPAGKAADEVVGEQLAADLPEMGPVLAGEGISRGGQAVDEAAARGPLVSSGAAGAQGSPYERWLAAREDGSAGERGPGAMLSGVLDDAGALARSIGLPAVIGVAALVASLLAAAGLARTRRGKETNQVAGKKMLCTQGSPGGGGYKASLPRRLSTFGELRVMRQAK